MNVDDEWYKWDVEMVASRLVNADQASTVWRRHGDYSKLDVRTIYVADANDALPTPVANIGRHQIQPQEIKLEDVAWSVRAFNILKRDGFKTLGDITQRTSAELLSLRNSGKRVLDEIIETLAEHDLKLKEE
ncbi:MAG: DNA-directed RNA polymerase subunit alpha C-terminal domain-containing protein [Candidatus Berkelbacteria bacterium]